MNARVTIAIATALVLTLQCSGAWSSTPVRDAQLTAFCTAARPHLRHDALDPANVASSAKYVPARPLVVMGQKVHAASKRLAMQGTVVLGLVINSVGRAAHVAVLEKSEYQALDNEATAILKDADYSPATLDGAPVRSCMLIRFTFKVAESASAEGA